MPELLQQDWIWIPALHNLSPLPALINKTKKDVLEGKKERKEDSYRRRTEIATANAEWVIGKETD